MKYKYAIHYHDGEVLTITDEEKTKVKNQILAGAEWLEIQGELINTKSIKKVGNHHATSDIKKIHKYQNETNKKIENSTRKILTDTNKLRHYLNN